MSPLRLYHPALTRPWNCKNSGPKFPLCVNNWTVPACPSTVVDPDHQGMVIANLHDGHRRTSLAPDDTLCFYHRRFGDKAQCCTMPYKDTVVLLLTWDSGTGAGFS
eukprot:scpid108837/ scgid4441/ 